MKFGALLMPSHLPERSMRDDQRWNLNDPEQLDALGFEKGQIEVYFTAARRLCSAPELRDQVLVGIIP